MSPLSAAAWTGDKPLITDPRGPVAERLATILRQRRDVDRRERQEVEQAERAATLARDQAAALVTDTRAEATAWDLTDERTRGAQAALDQANQQLVAAQTARERWQAGRDWLSREASRYVTENLDALLADREQAASAHIERIRGLLAEAQREAEQLERITRATTIIANAVPEARAEQHHADRAAREAAEHRDALRRATATIPGTERATRITATGVQTIDSDHEPGAKLIVTQLK